MKGLIVSLVLLTLITPAYAREISVEDMRQIMQDTNCLVAEVEETKKSLAVERQETDKYIALANELNASNKALHKVSNSKRIGGIALGVAIGLAVGFGVGAAVK